MSKGRCSGCDFEGSSTRVLSHHRSCEGFAELYRSDPTLALLDPLIVYASYHQSEDAPADQASRPARSRVRGSRTAKSAGVPASRPSGPVTVEYWDWHPTILEDLKSI